MHQAKLPFAGIDNARQMTMTFEPKPANGTFILIHPVLVNKTEFIAKGDTVTVKEWQGPWCRHQYSFPRWSARKLYRELIDAGYEKF